MPAWMDLPHVVAVVYFLIACALSVWSMVRMSKFWPADKAKANLAEALDMAPSSIPWPANQQVEKFLQTHRKILLAKLFCLGQQVKRAEENYQMNQLSFGLWNQRYICRRTLSVYKQTLKVYGLTI